MKASSVRQNKFKEVEEAYGKSFWQVVEEFARRGATKKECAELVGYTAETFKHLLEQEAPPDIKWASMGERIGKQLRGHTTERQLRANRKIQRKRETWVKINGRTRPLSFWARQVGIRRYSMLRRYKKGFRGQQLIARPLTRSERGVRGKIRQMETYGNPLRSKEND